MNKQQLASRIWAAANKMRSKIDANEYKDYFLGFIFYKFLSDGVEKKLRADGWDDDEQKLRDLADAHPNAANLNLNKRFDLLMETVDKAKAKAYIEKIRGGITIKPKDVMIEADEILRDFLIV